MPRNVSRLPVGYPKDPNTGELNKDASLLQRAMHGGVRCPLKIRSTPTKAQRVRTATLVSEADSSTRPSDSNESATPQQRHGTAKDTSLMQRTTGKASMQSAQRPRSTLPVIEAEITSGTGGGSLSHQGRSGFGTSTSNTGSVTTAGVRSSLDPTKDSQCNPSSSSAQVSRASEADPLELQKWPDLTFQPIEIDPLAPYRIKTLVQHVKEWDDVQSLASDVMRYVIEQLEIAQATGKKPLIMVGEYHPLQSCLFVVMAALKAVHEQHGPGATLLMEDRPEIVSHTARVLIEEEDALMVKHQGGSDGAEQDRRLDATISDAPYKERCLWLGALKIHTASTLGFTVTGFDTQKGEVETRREQGMVETIREQIEGSNGPVVVVTGRHHVPELRQQLATQAYVISLASADPEIYAKETCRAPRDVARKEYVLTHAKVKPFRVSQKVESAPLQYVQFAASLGIQMTGEQNTTS